MLQAALACAEEGLPVFPCNVLKRPLTDQGLKDASRDRKQIEAWWKRHPRALIGVPMGAASGIWCVDLDSKEHGGADGLLAWDHLTAGREMPLTRTHTTANNGVHVFFRWVAEHPVTNRRGSMPPGIDVRGEGGYVIWPPSELEDGRGWSIPDSCETNEIAEAPDWLYAMLAGPRERNLSMPKASGPIEAEAYVKAALEGELTNVRSALPGQRNETLNRAAFALGQFVGAGALQVGDIETRLFNAACDCGLVAEDGQTPIMKTIASGVGAGMREPRQLPERPYRNGGSAPSSAVQADYGSPTGEASRPLPNGGGNGRTEGHVTGSPVVASAPPPPVNLTARPFVLRDGTQLPMRQFVYGTHFIRRFLSCTIATGGVGKSSLAIVEALAQVTGRPLLGVSCEPVNVWYWNGEDPYEEIERRITAACLHYNITAAEISGRLFVNSGRETEIIIASQGRTGLVVNEALLRALEGAITQNDIGIFSVDPLVAAHRVNENDNMAIEAVVNAFTQLAEQAGCAIDLVHHTRKLAPGISEVTVEDSRGASALLAKARSARTLNVMTKDEADKAGVDRHRSYFRVDNGKSNLAPPPEHSEWYHLHSVALHNGPEGADGDHVAATETWAWPEAFEGVSVDALRKCQDAVAAGKWRADPRTKGEWVGVPIARTLGLDVDEPKARHKIIAMLKVWHENHMFKETTVEDQHRKKRKFTEVDQWAI